MERLPFSGLEVFLAVAEHGSLRRAAAALDVQPPAVSYGLKTLERQIGAALFVRTTRSVQLTDAGRSLLARARPAVAELHDALEDARSAGGTTKGTVRISLPSVAHDLTIGRRLAAFQARFPEIVLELSFDEAFVDIVAGSLHAGVRLGDHISSDMIAVRLTPPFREAVFASPSYLEARGRPLRPADLLRHNCIRYRYIASGRMAEWQFLAEQGTTTVDVGGNLVVNSTNALLDAARNGLGLGWLFRPSIEDDLRAGRLETVLDLYAIERPGYFLYFPKANARVPALRAFTDFMRSG